eukprot:IDg13636t1
MAVSERVGAQRLPAALAPAASSWFASEIASLEPPAQPAAAASSGRACRRRLGSARRALRHAAADASDATTRAQRHLATHQDLRTFQCPHCVHRFRNKAQMNMHQLSKTASVWRCELVFVACSSLKWNITYVHDSNPLFFCSCFPAEFKVSRTATNTNAQEERVGAGCTECGWMRWCGHGDGGTCFQCVLRNAVGSARMEVRATG